MKQAKLRSLDSVLWRLLLLGMFLPLLILTILGVAVDAYMEGRNLETQQRQLARSLTHTVDDYLDQAGRVLGAVAQVAETSTPEELARYMQATWQAYGYFDTFYRLDESGVITLLIPSDLRYQGLDMSSQSFFQQGIAQTGLMISQPFTSLRTGQPTVYMTWPLKAGGLVVGELNLGALQEAITPGDREVDRDSVFIADHSGTLLAHPQPELVAQQTNVGNLEIVRQGLTGEVTLRYTGIDGGFFLGSATPVERTGWVVVVQVPLFVAYGPHIATVVLTLLLSPFIWLAIVWALRRQFSRHVIAPLTRLGQGADALAAGDFAQGEVLVDISAAFAEVDALGANFHRMSQAIQARQAALQESEAKYRELVQNANSIILRLDTQGRITFFNEFAQSFFGYAEDEILGQHTVGVILPERDTAGRDLAVMVQDLVQHPEQYANNENENIRRSGERVWVAWTNKAVLDSDGQVVEILCVGNDITERKRVEEEIRRRNRELALLNRVIAASVSSLEPEAILKTACRELALAFEVPQAIATLLNEEKTEAVVVAEYPSAPPTVAGDHLTGSRLSALHSTIPLEDNPLYQYVLDRKVPLVVADVEKDPRLAPLQDLLHQYGTTSIFLLPLVIENEVIGGLALDTINSRYFSAEEVSLAWNVAEQVAGVLARARLVEERRRLSTAIEQTAESVIITDTEGTISYVNPTFERVSGYSQVEALGQKMNILKSGKQDPAFYQELWETISAGEVWHGRFVNKKKDGTFYTEEATISPVRDESGDIVNYVGVQRDVTREMQLEEQYRQGQKMEAVGRLAAGIAHDFNNLLTVINGFAALIQFELAPDDPLQESVDKILRSGQRAADLVRQLLAFSRKQIIEPKVLDLNTVVAELDSMLQRLIGEDITLTTILTPGLWPVKADPTQIEQIVVNLAVNARDVMPAGGKLTIETANITLDQDYTRQNVEVTPGDYVMLTVTDSGIGMSEEVQEHIFEPFFTTKEVGQGTGLGLATVFGVVKQSGGHISVYSEPGQGTTFKIYLPRVTEATVRPPQSDQGGDLPQGTETILLVEDETEVRELASRALLQQGYNVLEAANGQEALHLTQEYGQEIHLLLTDVIMPQMDGKALADQLKDLHSHIKVLFTSGYTDDVITRYGVLDPDVTFIQKPFSPTTLAYKVREVLDQ